jgi:CRP-like cAMP-binding protein
MLRSWGNLSEFACYFSELMGDERGRVPMTQKDFASELEVPPERISEIVRSRRKQGLLVPGENRRLLIPATFQEKAAGV